MAIFLINNCILLMGALKIPRKKKSILTEGLGLGDLKIKSPKLPKIKPISNVILKFDSEEKRVPLPASTKKKVYENAKGRCQSCGIKMKIRGDGGQFHHTRKPTVKSRPSSIQFLCARCHIKHGHKKGSKTDRDILGNPTGRKQTIKRNKVRKHKSPYW